MNANTGFMGSHPLKMIMSGWNDSRVNASFVSMLTSLQHPYINYMIGNNTDDLINADGSVTNNNS